MSAEDESAALAEAHSLAALSSWVSAAPRGIGLGPAELAASRSLARGLGLDADSYYLECRLSGAAQTDLLLSYGPNSCELPALIACGERRAAACSGRARAAWSGAYAFIARWASQADPLRAQVSAIWLEFDDVFRPFEAAAPSLSACIVPRYDRHYRAPSVPPRAADGDTLGAVYRTLAGDGCEPATVAALASATNALPDGGKFIHLSLMSAREPCAAKLYGVVPRGALREYLRAIEWQGSFPLLERTLARLATPELCGDELYFDLNLDNFRDPERATLGVAFAQQQIGLKGTADASRAELVAGLVREEQCSAAWSPALCGWAIRSEPSPSGLRHHRVTRWLDVKTVLGPGQALASKAYFGFRLRTTPSLFG